MAGAVDNLIDNLTKADEVFDTKVDNERYKKWLKDNKVMNPEDPRHFYDYRGAYEAGAKADGVGKWPSKFKHDLHPHRYLKTETGWFDTKHNRAASQEEVLYQSSLFNDYLLEQEKIEDWYDKSTMYGN